MTTTTPTPVGDLLRRWRTQRRLSQLDLAIQAGVSTRHLSCVENGRSKPSRDLVLHLAEELSVPLRERNTLLTAAGFAPVFAEGSIDDPSRSDVLDAIGGVLDAHEPWPAIVVDRRWDLVRANQAATRLFSEQVAPELLQGSMNVLRVTLHPDGLAPRITNLPVLAAHILSQLHRQIDVTGDATLIELAEELETYVSTRGLPVAAGAGVSCTMQLRRGDELLSFVSMIATFGTAVDATLADHTIETFLPADAATAASLRSLAA